MPSSIEADLLPLRTSVKAEGNIGRSRHADIARKRNAGLALARLCGWRRVMFLDDDIRGLTVSIATRAAALASTFTAVGFAVDCYPDNSVVCHAHRLASGSQGTFPGGSALVVDVARCDGFFPSVYNEDWLFLFNTVSSRSLAVSGTLSQLKYQPFAHPERAASEEFGDVIGEGLYRLIHQGANLADATCSYWRDMLARRSQFIDDIAERLMLAAPHRPVHAQAMTSLAAARAQLIAISPVACTSFIRAWQADLNAWRDRLLSLPAIGNLTDAAGLIRLPGSDTW